MEQNFVKRKYMLLPLWFLILFAAFVIFPVMVTPGFFLCFGSLAEAGWQNEIVNELFCSLSLCLFSVTRHSIRRGQHVEILSHLTSAGAALHICVIKYTQALFGSLEFPIWFLRI